MHAREAIGQAMDWLGIFPFSCRKATSDDPFLREMLIPFGRAGYVALFEIEDEATVTILAVRHQREDDYLWYTFQAINGIRCVMSGPSLQAKKAYFARVRGKNYAASLRLERSIPIARPVRLEEKPF